MNLPHKIPVSGLPDHESNRQIFLEQLRKRDTRHSPPVLLERLKRKDSKTTWNSIHALYTYSGLYVVWMSPTEALEGQSLHRDESPMNRLAKLSCGTSNVTK